MAIYQKPRTSIPNLQHRKFPYLLRDLEITRSNQAWCTDITYIPLKKGFLYLIAIMDRYSRKVLSRRVSNTMDVDFCIIAPEKALAKYGTPDIFNTNQGSQFTGFAFTNALQAKGIRISMDGQGRWIDNVFIERLWRSLKYEDVYLHAYASGSEAGLGIGRWIKFYNKTRPHSKHGGKPPDECYKKTWLLTKVSSIYEER